VTHSEARDTLESARQHHRAGRLEEAKTVYLALLEKNPNDLDSLYGLSLALFAIGQSEQALPLIEKVVQLRPERPDFLYNFGVILNSLNRRAEAIAAFRTALCLKPDFAEAIFNLASALHAEGNLPEAIANYGQLLQLNPRHAAGYVNLGNAFISAGNLTDALAAFDRACEIAPHLAEAHYNRANALRALDRAPEAVEAYKEAVRLRPDWFDAWNNLGGVYRNLQQIDLALDAFQKTLALSPDHLGAICNIASIRSLQGDLTEGLRGYRRALEIDPNFSLTLTSMASALFGIGKYAEGVEALTRAIAREPDNAVAHWSLATALLAMGQWQQGWEEFEWRLKVFKSDLNRGFPQPQWDGSDISGKTLLLHAEGGHGDAIQFVRFVPMAAQSGAKIILECHPALLELFRQIPGVTQLIPRGEDVPHFDFHCPLLSLPRIFHTTVATIPSQSPYFKAPPDRVEKFRSKLPAGPQLKVGLVWAGRPLFADLRTRTIDIFAPLANISNVRFFSFQRGAEAKQKPPEGMDLIDLTDNIEDFADAAGLLAHLDLFIGVDTAAVHLAGAMGKPVWTLNPLKTDFRWLLDREDTPWYPSMRLFRQPRVGDWQTPISRIVAELRKLVGAS
jgi:tetratricopeptide (TPR) repeat protein